MFIMIIAGSQWIKQFVLLLRLHLHTWLKMVYMYECVHVCLRPCIFGGIDYRNVILNLIG